MNLKNIPIKKQLIVIIMSATLAGLAIANILFLYQDHNYTKKETTERLHVLARIIANRSTAAIEFDDRDLALENLVSLSTDPTIEKASILDKQENLFAQYSKKEYQDTEDSFFHLLLGKHLFVSEPILLDGESIGTIMLTSNMAILENRLKEQAYVGGSIFVFLLFLTYFISSRLQKLISGPIEELTAVAQKITHDKEYSQRAKKHANNEIGILVTSFNSMLDNLQSAQSRLNDMNAELEEKVRIKTQELREINDSLEKRVEEEVKKNSEKDRLLFQQSKMAAMGEMIGNIAHQWRQPLNALSLIIGNIQDAFDFGKLDKAAMQRSTQKAYRLINKMSATIDDFRNFFSPDKDKQEFDPNELIEETLSLVEASFKHHDIEVIRNYRPGTYITGYKNELSQVLLNIINNAKDALVENKTQKPRISISTYAQEGKFRLIVKDNAGGIPEELIKRVFEPYFTTKHQTNGTGIGLYMSKIIIEEQMKGSLKVVNDSQGAVFTIILDAKDQ